MPDGCTTPLLRCETGRRAGGAYGRAIGRDGYRWRDVDQRWLSLCNSNSDLNLPTHSSAQHSTAHPATPHDTTPNGTALITQPRIYLLQVNQSIHLPTRLQPTTCLEINPNFLPLNLS